MHEAVFLSCNIGESKGNMSNLNANHQFWRLALVFPIIGCLLWLGTPARAAKSADRKVLFYQDSMHPWVKSDQPGKCTICAMD
jgi:hypothetical protein